jgi:hypothetical protein
MSDPIVKWPFGEASVAALTATGDQAIALANDMTIINGATTQATGNRTINLTIGAGVGVGAMIVAKLKTNGTETTTFGTGFTAPVMTGVAGKTKVVSFIYDGASFIQTGTAVQLD